MTYPVVGRMASAIVGRVLLRLRRVEAVVPALLALFLRSLRDSETSAVERVLVQELPATVVFGCSTSIEGKFDAPHVNAENNVPGALV